MKIRNGFVSNSSTSSFTCDICGYNEAGYDLSLSDINMCSCENGHTFCEDEMKVEFGSEEFKLLILNCEEYKYNKNIKEEFKKRFNKDIKDSTEEERKLFVEDDILEDVRYEVRYETPPSICPCCNFDNISKNDLKKYFFKKHNMTNEKLSKEIKEKFNNYNQFKEWINKK